MKKQVAIISPEYPPLTNWGGISTLNYNLSLLLSKMGFEVHVFSLNPNSVTNHVQVKKSITNHQISMDQQFSKLAKIYFKVLHPALDKLLKYSPNVIFVLNWNICVTDYFFSVKNKYDFISIHSPAFYAPSLLVKVLNKKIPLITHVQGIQKDFAKFGPKAFENNLTGWLERIFIYKVSNIIVTCNKNLMNAIKPNIKSTQILKYIPNFIQVKETKNLTKFNKYNLVFWGRIENRKGVEILITAWSNLKLTHPKLKLWLIGEKTQHLKLQNGTYGSLDEFLTVLNIKKEFISDIIHIDRINSKSKLQNTVKKLNGINIFPSYHEPFGYVYIESMALGLVTVGTKTSEAKKIITDGTDGFTCNPDSKSLEKTIQSILDMPIKKIKSVQVKSNTKINKMYSVNAIKKLYEKIYSNSLFF